MSTAVGTPPTAPRRSWAWRYPPVITLIVGVILAGVLLPSALNLPQANPTEVAEYAPVPPTDNNPPAIGNLGALGLGSSSTLNGSPLGNGDNGPLSGVDKSIPAELDCVIVDGTPHQTADPLSPPCVPSFTGNNYGATYQGVTGTEIRVIVYIDGGDGSGSAQKGDYCGFYSGEVAAKPNSMYYDYDKPPSSSASNSAFPETGSNAAGYVPEIRALDRYFNSHYQMYHRHVHMRLYMSGPPTNGTQCLSAQDRVRDAAQEIQDFHPFAVINDSASGQDAYANYMAGHGVVNFLAMNRVSTVPHVGFPEKFFESNPGLIWSYVPAIEENAQWEADWICKEVVKPGVVTFSGNPGENGKPRTYGLVRPQDQRAPTYNLFADAMTKDLQNCGVNFQAEEDIPTAGYDIDQTGAVDRNNPTQTDPNASSYAEKAMINFKTKGITTVIWESGTDNYTTNAAANDNYTPEWLLAGDGRLESTTDALVQAPSEWSHVFVVSRIPRLPDGYHQECYLAYAGSDPNAGTPGSFQGFVACGYYEDFRLLFTGIQVAGPRLTPSSMDQGFHAIPKVSLNTPYQPTCFFNPGEYTCIKDYEISWYNAQGTTPDGGEGCWAMVNQGTRYIEGNYPSGDVFNLKRPGSDPCNDYS